MTDNKAPELKPCPIAEAITDYYGERCPDFEQGCPICDAWAEYDRRADLHGKVKPLVWHKRASGNGFAAHGLGVMYTIDQDHDFVVAAMHEGYSTLKSAFDTVEQAEKWAQSKEDARILSTLEPAPITPAQAAVEKMHDRLDELSNLCVTAERRGPSFKGYVNDATFHHWCGQRSALHDALRAIAEGESDNG